MIISKELIRREVAGNIVRNDIEAMIYGMIAYTETAPSQPADCNWYWYWVIPRDVRIIINFMCGDTKLYGFDIKTTKSCNDMGGTGDIQLKVKWAEESDCPTHTVLLDAKTEEEEEK